MSTGMRCDFCRAVLAVEARFCSACGTPVASSGAGTASRRIVTVLFCDLVGSTATAEAADPEAIRVAMDAYYDACRGAIEQCAGVVEKFIGDAVMAVFGAYGSYEDGALRALRAALDILDRLVDLNVGLSRDLGLSLRVHCGVSSGEAVVVAQSPTSGARVIGDVVNTAARLESAAGAGEVLIDMETLHLSGAAVRVQPVQPLALKGKSSPVPAYRLLGVDEEPTSTERAPLIGRDVELDQLRQTYARVRRRRCCLVTVVGMAGIGKSRLVRAFLADPVLDGARVLAAACQPYGAGLAYRPAADLVRSLPDGWGEAVAALRAEQPGDERAVEALAAMLDLRPGSAQTAGTSEMAWAFRCLVEVLGRQRPLVLVLDNLHWAQPALLDLIMEVAGGVIDAEVLVICVSRSELLETHPQWGGGIGCATSFELDPLSVADSRQLVDLLTEAAEVSAQSVPSAETLERVAELCNGNPLHAELLLDTGAAASGGGIPPTIRVLITAWLDRLPLADRDLLERAATISTGAFSVDEVRFLAADSPVLSDPGALDEALRRLLRTGAIERAGPRGEYRIARALARDVTYEMTSKSRRAAWHAALADHLHARLDEADRYGRQTDGDLAYHLWSACRLRREILPGDEELPRLTERAAEALVTAGMRALRRRDLHDAVALLERGRDLLPAQSPDHRILAVRISDAYASLGDWNSAYQALDRLLAGAGGGVGLRTAQIQRRIVSLRSGVADHDPVDGAGLPDHDDLSWCRLHQLVGLRFVASGRVGTAEASMRAALVRAQRLGDGYEEERLLATICELSQWSPTPVSTGIALCEGLATRFGADRYLLIPILLSHARLEALGGRVELARQRLRIARAHAVDLRLTLGLMAAAQVESLVESLEGNHAQAHELLAEAARSLAAGGQPAMAAGFRIRAAWELVRAGDPVGAGQLAATVEPESLGSGERIVHTMIGAHAALAAAAVPQAREAVAAAGEQLDHVDDPVLGGDVLADSARILAACGQHEQARLSARRALAKYTAKGATRPRERLMSWLDEQEIKI